MRITKIFILIVLFVFAANANAQNTRVYKSYQGCKKSSQNCTYFELVYQTLQSGSARVLINSKLKDSLLAAVNFFPDMGAKDFKTAASNFIVMYDSSLAVQTNGAPWYMETTGEVNYRGKNVMSYSISQSMYTGGAHPNSYTSFYNFDKTTGNPITLNDIFGTGWEAPLNKTIDADFRKMKGLSPTDNLVDKAYLFENKITYNNNYAIEKKGLRFYYNNYDIAPYSTGPTDLLIPWGDLNGILPDASYYSK